MKYFPLFLDLDGADVLVAGGGEQAAQKVRLLRKTKARITVVAPRLNAELGAAAAQGAISVLLRSAQPGDVAGRRLVFAATGDRQRDADLAGAARHLGVTINVVDAPSRSSAIMPAIVDRAPITVAIGSEGTAPMLAREIRARLEALLPTKIGALACRAGSLRASLAKALPDARHRRHVWQRLFAGPYRRAVLEGRSADEAAILAAELAGAVRPRGRVALIGCGPGDPEHLTLKALHWLQEADVLVIDRLVNTKILEYARRDAERIFVGKRGVAPKDGDRPRLPTTQEEINAILVREAAAGKAVARLKGGDPSIFGRACEEMAAVQRAGFAVDVIPGITAAQACAARLKLPLTRRGKVRQFFLATGATAEGAAPDLDWRALTRSEAAAVIYMGVANASLLRAKLSAAGAAADTPIVIIENATLPQERAIATSLADMTQCINELAITGPAIIFVGLDWAAAGLTRPAFIGSYRRTSAASASAASILEVTS